MGMAMDWIRAHVLPRHSVELPVQLREASHRAANESAMIRSEVVQAAGGYAEYQRKARETRAVIDLMMGRVQ